MPIECETLRDAPIPLDACPKCGARPFDPFMRGMVQRRPVRGWLSWLGIGKPQPYCAVICWSCKEIVAWE